MLHLCVGGLCVIYRDLAESLIRCGVLFSQFITIFYQNMIDHLFFSYNLVELWNPRKMHNCGLLCTQKLKCLQNCWTSWKHKDTFKAHYTLFCNNKGDTVAISNIYFDLDIFLHKIWSAWRGPSYEIIVVQASFP